MTDPDSPTETSGKDGVRGSTIIAAVVLSIGISLTLGLYGATQVRKARAQINAMQEELKEDDQFNTDHFSNLLEGFDLGNWVEQKDADVAAISKAIAPYANNNVLASISGELKVHNVATLITLVKAVDGDMDGITNDRDLCPTESTVNPVPVPDVNQDGCNDETDSTARLAKFGINGVKGVRKVGTSWRVTYTATAKSPADEAEIKFEVSCLALDNEGKELAADATIADGWAPTHVDKCFVRPASAS